MGSKWKGAAGQPFSEGWPPSLRNCLISSKCVLFSGFLKKNCVQRPQPTNAYFGQKDIQQSLLLRRLVGDLHLPHPTPDHLHIVPTARDATNGLALSSRNVYLTPAERQLAPAFYAALQDAARAWAASASKRETVQCALKRLEAARVEGEKRGVKIRVDYIEMNDSDTFEIVGDEQVQPRSDCAPVILSGAVWFGRTRLIDNMILGNLEGVVAN
jgi:pantoate--beta-alanine ligase